MGVEYLSYVKSIATFAPTFYGHIISVGPALGQFTKKRKKHFSNKMFLFSFSEVEFICYLFAGNVSNYS